MLLWLPLFSGSALAATVSMQMGNGSCHEAAMPQTMSHHDMGEHHHHTDAPAPADRHAPACDSCGVCHLVCTGYLSVPAIELAAVQATAREATPYLLAFSSITSAPLVPPPLVHA
jgi:hypothetical protein